MGRGHASLLIDVDTRRSAPLGSIGHPLIYYPTIMWNCCRCTAMSGRSEVSQTSGAGGPRRQPPPSRPPARTYREDHTVNFHQNILILISYSVLSFLHVIFHNTRSAALPYGAARSHRRASASAALAHRLRQPRRVEGQRPHPQDLRRVNCHTKG